MSEWFEICSVDDVPPLGARVVCTPVGPVAVFRTRAGDLYALEDRCPHKGGPLSQGIVHGERVTCPLHDWVFELKTGAAVAPDEGEVRTYAVRVDGDVVFVELPAERRKRIAS